MPEPPKLDYFAPAETKKKSAGKRVIGFFGFVVYGLLAFVIDSRFIFGFVRWGRFPRNGIEWTFALAGAFCTWRAVAALIQLVR